MSATYICCGEVNEASILYKGGKGTQGYPGKLCGQQNKSQGFSFLLLIKENFCWIKAN